MPLPGIVMPLILKPHRDVIAVERPQVLDQAILMLPAPFAGEECYDRGAAFERLGAVAPAAVLGIGQRPALGIARIPGVFGHAGFLGGGLFRKRRKRGTRHADLGFGVNASVASPSDESMARYLSPDSYIKSAFIATRSAFGIGRACPPEMNAT